jgi:hypothetical protein
MRTEFYCACWFGNGHFRNGGEINSSRKRLWLCQMAHFGFWGSVSRESVSCWMEFQVPLYVTFSIPLSLHLSAWRHGLQQCASLGVRSTALVTSLSKTSNLQATGCQVWWRALMVRDTVSDNLSLFSTSGFSVFPRTHAWQRVLGNTPISTIESAGSASNCRAAKAARGKEALAFHRSGKIWNLSPLTAAINCTLQGLSSKIYSCTNS